MTQAALDLLSTPYPQRATQARTSWLDGQWERLRAAATGHLRLSSRRQKVFVAAVDAAEARLSTLDSEARRTALADCRRRLRAWGVSDALVAEAFALIRLASAETLGMRHFPAQVRGGYVMVRGCIAEMNTGEGKTLTATLAAATMALSGRAVHVVTVNDYLAERDALEMGRLYAALGLTTGVILETMEAEEKRQQYARDIVYCTSKTLTFDYLRDRLELGDRMRPLRMAFDRVVGGDRAGALLRGLQFALVDEADSIFIDEARTPLIISAARPDPAMEDFYRKATELAAVLEDGTDYRLTEHGRMVRLTPDGTARLEQLAGDLGGLWAGTARREEIVSRALAARHGFVRDVDYIVRDGKVMLVDENTGRVMPDRSWEAGLQQLVEVLEEVEISPEKETLARISFQMFFRRYQVLAGMTGTCREVAGEIGEVYGLPVVRIPPQRPSRRVVLPRRLLSSGEARWAEVVAAIRERTARNQPVVVGTRSIAASERLSGLLEAAGVAHQVLNAKQDKEEAAMVARAGEPGRVTIATNMAGRGTDIKLTEASRAAGGLHVILTEGHDNARVDRQLAGRCARQGDPGSFQAILSVDDDLIRQAHPLVGRLARGLLPVSPVVARAAYRWAQRRREAEHRGIRRTMMKADLQLRESLSFTGQME